MSEVITKITPKHDITWWVKWASTVFILAGIISISLVCSIFIASFSGKELDTIPIWLVK